MKTGFLSRMMDVGSTLVRRVLGRAETAEAKAVTETTAKVAEKATPGVLSYNKALDTTRELGHLAELGLVEGAKFERKAVEVLNSNQAGILASDVARATARAIVDQPQSAELKSVLAKSHRQLDANISERTSKINLSQDSEALATLHTQNIRDARTMVQTGATGTLKDDALKDIASSLDRLQMLDPKMSNILMGEISKDPKLASGVADAARKLHDAENRPSIQAAGMFKPQGSKPATFETGHEGRRAERNRNLGLPELDLPPERPAQHFDDPNITSQIHGFEALERAAFEARLRANQPAPKGVQGVVVSDVDMSVFTALQAEAAGAAKPAVTAPMPKRPGAKALE